MTEELKAYVVISLAPGERQELRPFKVYLHEKDAVDETVRLAVEAKETKSGYTFSGSEVQLVAPEITRLRAALDARDASIKVAEEAPHEVGCSVHGHCHLPGFTHYETDGNDPCPAYHYRSGKCDCWKLRFDSALAALAAAKEGA